MEIFNNKYQDCIDFLNDCAQVCFECFNACLKEDDLAQRGELLKSLTECAEHCQLSVAFLTRNSTHAEEMAKISAHLAKVTAEICENFDDEHTALTAKVCLETASSCIECFDD